MTGRVCGKVRVVQQFPLQRREKTFRDRVVPTIAPPTHARDAVRVRVRIPELWASASKSDDQFPPRPHLAAFEHPARQCPFLRALRSRRTRTHSGYLGGAVQVRGCSRASRTPIPPSDSLAPLAHPPAVGVSLVPDPLVIELWNRAAR